MLQSTGVQSQTQLSHGTTTKDRELFIVLCMEPTVEPESCAQVGSDGNSARVELGPPSPGPGQARPQQAVGKGDRDLRV